MYRFRTPEGEWLVLAADGVTLSAEPEREELTWWTLEPAYGGWNIVNAEMTNMAIQVWKGLLEAYQPGEEDTFVFNFYEPVDE